LPSACDRARPRARGRCVASGRDAVDADFGPFFIKFGGHFPYNARLGINGNEWAKRQTAKAGIGFEPLDNGSR
jgi:hypothetical protein